MIPAIISQSGSHRWNGLNGKFYISAYCYWNFCMHSFFFLLQPFNELFDTHFEHGFTFASKFFSFNFTFHRPSEEPCIFKDKTTTLRIGCKEKYSWKNDSRKPFFLIQIDDKEGIPRGKKCAKDHSRSKTYDRKALKKKGRFIGKSRRKNTDQNSKNKWKTMIQTGQAHE